MQVEAMRGGAAVSATWAKQNLGFRWIQHYIASHFGVDLYDKN